MIKEFISLRSILVVLVFIHHLDYFPNGGPLAVSVFFVLSGFCSYIAYEKKVPSKDFIYHKYLLRKACKYYPLHWFCLFVSFCASGFLIFKKALLLNFLLLQSWSTEMAVYYSYNGVSWYLSNTLFQAAMMPVVVKYVAGQRRSNAALIFLSIILLYTILPIIIPSDYQYTLLYINPLVRVFDFIVGVFGAHFYMQIRERMRLSRKQTLLISSFSILFLIILSVLIPHELAVFSFLFWPLTLVLLISLALGQGQMKFFVKPVFQVIGKYSFEFYMIHNLIIVYLKGYADSLLGNVFLSIVFLFLLTLLSSWLLRKFFVIPATKHLQKSLALNQDNS